MSDADTMKAMRFHQYGGSEQLVLERVPRPVVQPGSVLVRVKAAGVNQWDWKLRSGALHQYMPVQFPYIPGIELAGRVDEVGPGVAGFQRGEAVYGTGSGTTAEFAVVPGTGLAPMPKKLNFDQAAAAPIGSLTAWRALFDLANLQRGQRVLVLGAAGGVGSFAVQLAHWRGAHVIGTASSGNLDYVRSLGAEEALDYQAVNVETAVRDVDVVLDTVGGSVGEQALPVLRPGGLFLTSAGMPPQEPAQALGVRAAMVGAGDQAQNGDVLRQITELIEAGGIKVHVSKVFPLAEAGRAHALSQEGHGRGRIVLHVAD